MIDNNNKKNNETTSLTKKATLGDFLGEPIHPDLSAKANFTGLHQIYSCISNLNLDLKQRRDIFSKLRANKTNTTGNVNVNMFYPKYGLTLSDISFNYIIKANKK